MPRAEAAAANSCFAPTLLPTPVPVWAPGTPPRPLRGRPPAPPSSSASSPAVPGSPARSPHTGPGGGGRSEGRRGPARPYPARRRRGGPRPVRRRRLRSGFTCCSTPWKTPHFKVTFTVPPRRAAKRSSLRAMRRPGAAVEEAPPAGHLRHRGTKRLRWDTEAPPTPQWGRDHQGPQPIMVGKTYH